MDSGPGRCRRTDGRKWRCSKKSLPYQKYCERHMHRGRSRKHVEPIKSISRPDNITSDDNNKSLIMSSIASDIDNRLDLDQNQPCSDYIKDIPANFNRRNDENRDDLLAIAGSYDVLTVGNEVENNTDSKKIFAMSEGDHAKGKSSCDDANLRKVVRKKQCVGRNEYVSFVSSRFGSSPRSVLHSASGKVDPNLDSKNIINMEKQRCRRTDGKKWQCRRDAIPNQKYCTAHMHRGAKKFVLNPQTVSDRDSLARRAQTCSTVTKNLDNGINLNTVPTSPQCITGNDSSCSTSDATTITDENISFCLAQSLCNS